VLAGEATAKSKIPDGSVETRPPAAATEATLSRTDSSAAPTEGAYEAKSRGIQACSSVKGGMEHPEVHFQKERRNLL